MDAKEIKIEFIRRDISQTAVAEMLNVSPSLVQRVITRKAVSRKVMDGISAAIGKETVEVFPELAERQGRRRLSACEIS